MLENSTNSDQWHSLQIKWRPPKKYPAGKITIRYLHYFCSANKQPSPIFLLSSSQSWIDYYFFTFSILGKIYHISWNEAIRAESELHMERAGNGSNKIGNGFCSASPDWLRRWRELFEPITERSEATRKQFRITFLNWITQSKTTLSAMNRYIYYTTSL